MRRHGLESIRRKDGTLTGAEAHDEVWIGVYRAKVVDNTDRYGRLQVVIPEVTRDATHPNLAWPVSALLGGGVSEAGVKYGSLFVPPVGAAVWVEFQDGDRDHPVWLPGWFGNDEMPDTLARHFPNRRGLVTPSGHYLYFDDDGGSDGDAGQVELGVAHGGGAFSKVTIDKTAKISISTKQGRQVVIDDGSGIITVNCPNGVVVNTDLTAQHLIAQAAGPNPIVVARGAGQGAGGDASFLDGHDGAFRIQITADPATTPPTGGLVATITTERVYKNGRVQVTQAGSGGSLTGFDPAATPGDSFGGDFTGPNTNQIQIACGMKLLPGGTYILTICCTDCLLGP